MRIMILAMGSRGDVQPYVALGLGLQQVGHEVHIVASDDFETFVTNYGLRFFPLGVSVKNLMTTGGMQSALASGQNVFRGFSEFWRAVLPVARRVRESAWNACQEAEAILSSFGAGLMGDQIAEKLGIPVFEALLQPMLSRTRAFPHVGFPDLHSGAYNLLTHLFAEQILQLLWVSTRRLHRKRVPFIYGFSPAVIPRPPDWGDHIHITGYWFLDHPPDWQPPADLVDFLEAGPPPVYVGFGSMLDRDPETATEMVLKALARTGQRGILMTGWGGLSQSDLPDDVFKLKSIPHSWLFPRMAAVVHHGGVGTTAEGLRAGIPSIVVPFMLDQPFWGERVKALGVGPVPIPRKQLTAERLAYAIRVTATHEPMGVRAAALGERIRAEDGVGEAVRILEQTLTKK